MDSILKKSQSIYLSVGLFLHGKLINSLRFFSVDQEA